jgi:division/cell wall cluster transcriptional repressor MraZ
MVQEKIMEMLAEKLECEVSEINAESTFAEMGIDSLDVAELVMNLEDEFGISLEMNASLNTVAAVTAKIEELPFAKERRVRRYFYAYSEDGSIDAQGRVTVNKDFREFANLEKDVVIIGNRNHFEIWSAAAWEEEKNAFDNEDITNELIELGF